LTLKLVRSNHSEGHSGGTSEAWIEKQYAYNWESSAWELTSEFDWTYVGNGTSVPWHAQGGEIEFEGNSSYDDLYTANAKGDILEIGNWFDANPDFRADVRGDARRAIAAK